MKFRWQIFSFSFLYGYAFLFIRSLLSGVKSYQLNKSAYKKRKKGESFREWLLCTRFKEEIPKALRVLYYFVLLIHPACFFASLIVHIIDSNLNFSFGYMLVFFLFCFDAIWTLTIQLLFWTHRKGPRPYERWIKKRRGQKRRKRK